ncbi:MAG: P27 family phage terminase small subunit [Bacteroidales bacterium]
MGLPKSLAVDALTTAFIRNIKKELKDKDQYDSSLDFAIFQAAVQFSLMSKLSDQLLSEDAELIIVQTTREGNTSTKKNPLIEDFNRTAEQLRKALRELGLTIDSAKAGIGVDPVDDLLDKVNNA